MRGPRASQGFWAQETWSGRADGPCVAGSTGQLLWADNWVTFLDSMLQITILGSSQRSLRLPTRIGAVHIDPATHQRQVYAVQGKAQGSPAPHLCPSTAPVSAAAHTDSLSPQRLM